MDYGRIILFGICINKVTLYEWHEELFEYAKKLNIKIFSTPFDETAVELLTKLKCPFYKVASLKLQIYL